MIGILINPTDRTLSQVDVTDASAIGAVCGWQWFDIVAIARNADMFVDDEGLLSYPNPQGYFSLAGQTFAGRALVLGRQMGDEGPEACSLHLPELMHAILGANVEWLDTPPAEAVEPHFEIVEWDPHAEGD